MQEGGEESILQYLDALGLASLLLCLSRGSQCKGISANLDHTFLMELTHGVFSAWFLPGAWFYSNINISAQGQFLTSSWVC